METNNIGTDSRVSLLKATLGNRLGVLFLSFIVLLIAVSGLTAVLGDCMNTRDMMLGSSSLQNMLCFMLPAWLAAYLCSTSWKSYVGVDKTMHWRQLCGVVLFMTLCSPALNALVSWNESIHLPESMRALEESLRAMEENAADLTDVLLSDTSIWGLVSGVIVVGVLTGLGEEAFFRAGIQKALTSSHMNHHVAIWVSAFIFSAIHFQFFGFFPRLALGALFGYFYYSSGSLWVCATAHALNNSFVVVVKWLELNNYISPGADTFGADSVWTVAGCLCLTVVCVILLWKPLIKVRNNG